jgi:hypothetical protein
MWVTSDFGLLTLLMFSERPDKEDHNATHSSIFPQENPKAFRTAISNGVYPTRDQFNPRLSISFGGSSPIAVAIAPLIASDARRRGSAAR